MTDEQINKAIAEACGWKFVPEYCHGEDQPPEFTTVTPDGRHLCGYYPDYVDDLNAMHEAEKYLDDEQWLEYMLNLQDVLCCNPDRSKWTVCRENMSATAHQRAEAFLRTLNLWTE